MSEGGKEAIRADEEVVPASEARKLEDRVRELERLLGRKTMEVEILNIIFVDVPKYRRHLRLRALRSR